MKKDKYDNEFDFVNKKEEILDFLSNNAKKIFYALIILALFAVVLFPSIKNKLLGKQEEKKEEEVLYSDRMEDTAEPLPTILTPEAEKEKQYREVLTEKVDLQGNPVEGGKEEAFITVFGSYVENTDEIQALADKVNAAVGKYNYYNKSQKVIETRRENEVEGVTETLINAQKDLRNQECHYYYSENNYNRGEIFSSISVDCYEKTENGVGYCYFFNSEIGSWIKTIADDITTYDISALLEIPDDTTEGFEIIEHAEHNGKEYILLKSKEVNTEALSSLKDRIDVKKLSFVLYIDPETYLPVYQRTDVASVRKSVTQGAPDVELETSSEVIYHEFAMDTTIEVPEEVRDEAVFLNRDQME